ncbi:MAG: hypothetical protein CUN52_07030 [Phototrophicales bacterium]|nr:MAG: hypothetical protein CUN52_07030 [Phototrophicales bacterium]
MEYAPHDTRYSTRGCFIVIIMIFISIFACGTIFYVAVDTSCVNEADLWLVDYPNSRLIQETYSFMRPFGIGKTNRILYSEDPINAVRSWYMARDKRLIEAGNVKNRGYGRNTYLLDTAPDKKGTMIMLISNCAQGLSVGLETEKVSEN